MTTRITIVHSGGTPAINQDIIPRANDLHDKYSKNRKIIQETIEHLTDL